MLLDYVFSTLREDEQALVSTVSGSPKAIGIGGFPAFLCLTWLLIRESLRYFGGGNRALHQGMIVWHLIVVVEVWGDRRFLLLIVWIIPSEFATWSEARERCGFAALALTETEELCLRVVVVVLNLEVIVPLSDWTIKDFRRALNFLKIQAIAIPCHWRSLVGPPRGEWRRRYCVYEDFRNIYYILKLEFDRIYQR